VRVLLRRGARGKEAGRGAVKLVGVLTFYRGPGEHRGGVAREFNAGVNGFNAIEDGGAQPISVENRIWGDGNGICWCDADGSRLCPV
jgi:hypothetical protein